MSWLDLCPHCGGTAAFHERSDNGQSAWHVACLICGASTWRDARGFGYHGTNGKDRAQKDWNKRNL